MLIVFLIIVIAVIVAGVVLEDENVTVFGIIFAAGVVIWTFVEIGLIVSLRPIDERIAMYEEENARIEMQIAEAIENYQKHEHDVFTEVAPDSATTLIALYPELKSDTLVQQQIDVYISNNNKIRELKEKKLNESVYRWWLYFGR